MVGIDVVLRDASVRGVGRTDVIIRDGFIAEFGACSVSGGIEVIDVAGATVLPGLHDHHCHLLAMAAAEGSVRCGPPDVGTFEELSAALHDARPIAGWVRGIGYHESVAGELDRHALDRARADVPVRVQHRGGSAWLVNSVALSVLGLNARTTGEPAGIERGVDGLPTGRLWRCDDWLRDRLGPGPAPDLGAVSEHLASFGITGVTDATPDLTSSTVAALRSPSLRQRLTLLGETGSNAPRKLVVSDHALPTWDELVGSITDTRPRPVAVHCVTGAALALTVAALRDVGAVPGDRIEHAAVTSPDLTAAMAELGLTVVTQPSLPALRGDQYLDDVAPSDLNHLWPFATLLAAGVPVGCSSDAPYGNPDPWFSVASAVSRRTVSGAPLARTERVAAKTALRGYLSDPLAPGGPPRRLTVGAPADLAVLDAPLEAVLAKPDARHVQLTLVGGEVIYGE